MKEQIKFKNLLENPAYPGVFDISPEELNGLRGQIRIIDVRQSEEFTGELGHIPEAELIELQTIPQRVSELSKSEQIVMVCRSGGRSAQATAYLLQNGYSHIYNMKGGMILWNMLGLPKK